MRKSSQLLEKMAQLVIPSVLVQEHCLEWGFCARLWDGVRESVCEREKPSTIFVIMDMSLKLSLSSPTGAYEELRHKLLV